MRKVTCEKQRHRITTACEKDEHLPLIVQKLQLRIVEPGNADEDLVVIP